MGAKTTYQLEKALEPDSFRVDAVGSSYRRNKWGGYRQGKHTPSQKLISSVNTLYEGAQSEFEHVLWETLRLSKPATQNADAWVRRLAPDVQSILWKDGANITGNRTRIRTLQTKHLEMIERRASLDALACLTLLLREAHELGHMQQSFEIAKSLCRVLLIIGDVLNGHDISRPIYDYYEELILPLASWQEKRLSYRGINFLELVGWLHHGLYHLSDIAPHRLNEQEQVIYKLKIINGNYGFDYMWLLNPIEVSTKTDIDPKSMEYREQDLTNKLRQWALNSILTSKDSLSLPDEL